MTSPSDEQSIADTKAYYSSWYKKPHYFVPAQIGSQIACAVCGIGPGAIFHNEYEVERHLKEKQP